MPSVTVSSGDVQTSSPPSKPSPMTRRSASMRRISTSRNRSRLSLSTTSTCDSPRSDNLRLSETRLLPFLINMTCSSGAIDYPGDTFNICISEDFLRIDGGAIACFVPTGEGMATQHQRLTHWLMRSIFEEGQRRLGAITATAGWQFILEGQGSDLVEHFCDG